MIRQVRAISTGAGRKPATRPATRNRSPKQALTIFTVGHSTRSPEEFLQLLRIHEIEQIVDVRRFPVSRRFPHFSQEPLSRFLRKHRIGYRHLEALGGRRQPAPDSTNVGWRNAAFRGYADHMQTEEFEEALGQLIEIAGKRGTAILCAEAVPWRCHRWILSDAIAAHGIGVQHIISPSTPLPHKITPLAVRSGHYLTYPGPIE